MNYAGFEKRFWANLIDGVIAVPSICALFIALNSGRTSAVIILICSELICSFYPVIFISIWGQTIGKFVLKIKVIKINGDDCGWREGILRGIIVLLIQLTVSYFLVSILIKAPDTFFMSEDFQKKLIAFSSVSKSVFSIANITLAIWYFADTVTFFINKKHRALHDLIAGTAVIFKQGNADNSPKC